MLKVLIVPVLLLSSVGIIVDALDGLTQPSKEQMSDILKLIEMIDFNSAERVDLNPAERVPERRTTYAVYSGKTGTYKLDNETQGRYLTTALYRIQHNYWYRPSPTYATVEIPIGRTFGKEAIKQAFRDSVTEQKKIVLV